MSVNIPRDILLDEVDHLTASGESALAIAKALGTTPSAIARALRRAGGRSELARRFEQARRATEAHPCIDCGGLVSARQSKRCFRCGHVQRLITRRERGIA